MIILVSLSRRGFPVAEVKQSEDKVISPHGITKRPPETREPTFNVLLFKYLIPLVTCVEKEC